MFKSCYLIFFFISLIFIFPVNLFAAEVLYVKSSSLIQIGDRNRTFTVKIACIEVDPLQEDETLIWLKSELRRKTRINFMPKGTIDGILLARVNLIESKKDLAQTLADKGLANMTC